MGVRRLRYTIDWLLLHPETALRALNKYRKTTRMLKAENRRLQSQIELQRKALETDG